MQIIIPSKSRIRISEAGSVPVIMPYITVSVAPIPTHIAYDVPVDKLRIAYARPAMLAMSAIKKIIVGFRFVKPADLPSAVAHTASNTPDIIKTIHASILFSFS